MKPNYNNLDEYFRDLALNYLDYSNSQLTIDFTSEELKVQLSKCSYTVLDYLREELQDDCRSFGDGSNYTFELPLSYKDINQYSKLWKPKWDFLRLFFNILEYRYIKQVTFYLGDFT